jgi:hypothetical protein
MSVMLGVSFTITGSRILLAPFGDHLDVFGHLANGRAHAAFAHAVRAAEIEFDAIGAGVLDARQDRLPACFLARHHDRDDHRPVGPALLDLGDFAQIDLEIAVGDQLDVVEPQEPASGPQIAP